MDGVCLTTPTILQNVQNYSWGFGGSQSPTLPAEAAPSSVLLVVAQGGHRIAYHHPNTGEALPAPLARVPGFDPIVLADLLMTKAGRYEQLLDLTVGDCRLIGWPVALTLEPFMRASAPASGKGAPLSALNVVFTLAAAAAPSDEARYERVVAACKSATEQLALALQREEACGGFVSRHVFGVEEAAHAGVGAVAGADTSARSTIDETCISTCISMGSGSCASASANLTALEGGSVTSGGASEARGHAPAARAPLPSGSIPGVLETALLRTALLRTALPSGSIPGVLEAAFYALREGRPVTLRVGTRAEVAVCTPPLPTPRPRLAAAPGAMPPPPALRPYLTLLLLEGVISLDLP